MIYYDYEIKCKCLEDYTGKRCEHKKSDYPGSGELQNTGTRNTTKKQRKPRPSKKRKPAADSDASSAKQPRLDCPEGETGPDCQPMGDMLLFQGRRVILNNSKMSKVSKSSKMLKLSKAPLCL